MSINLKAPELRELKPRIMVAGVGGAGGNAVNNMITSGLIGVDFVVANTDAQALTASRADRIIQMGLQVTEGLGAGSQPEVGRAAAEEAIEEIRDHLQGAHMCFVTAGMGGGTGTGAAPVIAQTARDMGILTVGVVTKPFQFEGQRRMRLAEGGIQELQDCVDTLIVIPNQNLFRVANEKTTFADAFAMADQVLYSGVACITDLMVKEGLINLDFADVRAVMREMGKAMMGTGEASGEGRAVMAAEAAIANPLLDETSMKGARGLLISITGGNDLTLYEVDEAASRIRQEVDEEANIILGATFDDALDGIIRVSVVATGIDHVGEIRQPAPLRIPAAPRALTATPAAAAEPGHVEEPVSAIEAAMAEHSESADDGQGAAAQDAEREAQERQAHEYHEAQARQEHARQEHARQEQERQELAHQEQVRHEQLRRDAAQHAAAQQEKARQALAQHAAAQQAAAEQHARAQREYALQQEAYRQQQEAAAAYHDQQAEVVRPVPMPRVEDLPLPVQQQLRAQREDAPVQNGPEQKRRSLLERLASFGGSREADAAKPAAPVAQAAPQAAPILRPMQQQAPVAQRPALQAPAVPSAAPAQPAPAAGQQQPAHAMYGKKPAAAPGRPQQPQLDLHGRPQAPLRPIEDEQLEIPAFLRRQTG